MKKVESGDQVFLPASLKNFKTTITISHEKTDNKAKKKIEGKNNYRLRAKFGYISNYSPTWFPGGIQNNERNAMNKQDLIDAVAIKTGSTKVAASEALVAVLDTIKETLAKGDKVSLIGFGTFETSKRAARTGRNPQTGAPLKIAAATVPKFSAGKGLKDAVNIQPKATPKAKGKAKK